MISMRSITGSARKTLRPSRPSSSASGWPRGAGSTLLLLLVLLPACSHRIETIQASRMPEALPDGQWAVTSGWLQEQGELIRGWRARAQACEGRAKEE